MKLVFIHGRAQQGKDASALKQEWLAALRAGLAVSDLTLPLGDDNIRLAYYGDTLDQLVAGCKAEQVAEVIIRGNAPADAQERSFMQDVIAEMVEQTAIEDELPPDIIERSPLHWHWVQAALRVIDRRVPLGSGSSVALFTRDVYVYLTRIGIRDQIEAGVLRVMEPDEPAVVVAHSLGSVVAYNLLRREGESRRWNVPLFLTLGSPLAITRIRNALAPTTFPECAGEWRNASDKRDVVALYPLEPPHFHVTPTIHNRRDVVNPTPNHHGITGYLADAGVARWIYDGVKAYER